MSLEQTIEIWETDEHLVYQIRHFLSVIRSDKLFSHYIEKGVPENFLREARNYAEKYDQNLYQKLQQIPTKESLEKKALIQT